MLLSEAECKIVVKKYFNEKPILFNLLKYEVVPLNVHGFTNKYFLLTISIFHLTTKYEQELKFVAKLIDDDNGQFYEISSYNWIKHLNIAPKVYWSRKNDLIIFENFSESGYVLPENPNNLDVPHIQLVLESLAKCHTVNSTNIENINCGVHRLKSDWFKNGLNTLFKVFESLPKITLTQDPDLKIKLQQLYAKSANAKTLKCCRSVLCHGYMWGNNILFAYNDGKPTKCIVLDWEMQHTNYPAYDVLHFLYGSTTSIVRQKYLHQLLEYYYNCLVKEQSACNLKQLPMKEDFEVSVHYLLPVVKLENICFTLLNQTLEPSKVQDLKRISHLLEPITEFMQELNDSVLHHGLKKEDCYKIIENAIGTTEYQLLKYDVTQLGKMGGYVGNHNKLEISVCLNDDTIDLHLFAKFMPKTGAALKVALDSGAYSKEIFFYEIFVSTLKRLGITSISECIVPCYFTRHNDVLIFENIEPSGYKTLDPRKPFSYEIVIIVMKKLAKFHAASIICEELLRDVDTNYRIKQHFQNELTESLYSKVENHHGARVIHTGIASVELLLSLFPTDDPALCTDLILNKIKLAYRKIFDLVGESMEYRNVICHGDLWINNILVQVVDGVPTDCRFVDFQLMRYCPPAHDVVTFLYLCTNRAFRKKNFNSIVKEYYQEFKSVLENHGYNVDDVYPYSKFLTSIDDSKQHAICQNVLYYQLCLIDQEIFKNFMVDDNVLGKALTTDRNDYIKYLYDHDPIFKSRMAEVVQELRESVETFVC